MSALRERDSKAGAKVRYERSESHRVRRGRMKFASQIYMGPNLTLSNGWLGEISCIHPGIKNRLPFQADGLIGNMSPLGTYCKEIGTLCTRMTEATDATVRREPIT